MAREKFLNTCTDGTQPEYVFTTTGTTAVTAGTTRWCYKLSTV